MQVAIVGCGLIGNKRAASLGAHRLVAAADADLSRALKLAANHADCRAHADWQTMLAREGFDIAMVCTTNDHLAAVATACVRAGKHVLVEKPAGRRAAELAPLRDAQLAAGTLVKVGFNHRFHPSLLKAREIWETGACGPLMYIRGRYGQGGRLGMEKEWRGQRAIAGGGEMLDQGVHLIDLARWFAGDFVEITGQVARCFWTWEVEDNGFALLKTAAGQIAWLHASCTEWKNTFSFEIFGRNGKLQIDGLGGSYGTEKLTHFQMRPQMGPPLTSSWEWPFPDDSWSLEIQYFIDCISACRPPEGNLDDAIAAMTIVEKLYEQSPPLLPGNTA